MPKRILKRILIYGFKPFGEFPTNVTEEIIRELRRRVPEASHVRLKVFDVTFDREQFECAFDKFRPDIIIGMGQHPRARKIRHERKARNAWARRKMKPRPIEPRMEALRMSLRLPEHDLACVTYDAGTYVCNFSMYWSERWAREHDASAAFLHVPRTISVTQAAEYILELLRNL